MTRTAAPRDSVVMDARAELAIETLLYATSEPPQAELTVLTASSTRVELSVGVEDEREDARWLSKRAEQGEQVGVDVRGSLRVSATASRPSDPDSRLIEFEWTHGIPAGSDQRYMSSGLGSATAWI